MKTTQLILSTAAGKELIALALCRNEQVLHALNHGTLAIVAGTTNQPIAAKILEKIGESGFDGRFFRGVISAEPIPHTLGELEGDVIIQNGKWLRGKTILEAAPEMKPGDLILKGANAVNPFTREAAVLVGSPVAGTIAACWTAHVGRRVGLLMPVGLEKRVMEPIAELCRLLNDGEAAGCRLAPSPGIAYTEIDAIRELTGAQAHLAAAGGVCGMEGAIFLHCVGTQEQIEYVKELENQVKHTPAFAFPQV